MASEALLPAWHDFFVLIGTAAATLIGAMFVVVSIGIGILTRERSVAIHTFLTATVIHLSTVLFGSALTMVPVADARWLATIAGVAGIAGIGYSGWVIRGFNQHSNTVLSDRLWYAIFPLIAYTVLVAAAALGLRSTANGMQLFAAVLAFLLITGIRNAWDMLVFLVISSRDPT
ncbi:MAG TPA: hypothetical protein VGR70_20590 [Stellaceae bacterium]|nr:hypothetical protein [Stellaceae bacterium]